MARITRLVESCGQNEPASLWLAALPEPTDGDDRFVIRDDADVEIDGGAGNDLFIKRGSGDATLWGGVGDDRFDLRDLGRVTVYGGEGADSLSIDHSRIPASQAIRFLTVNAAADGFFGFASGFSSTYVSFGAIETLSIKLALVSDTAYVTEEAALRGGLMIDGGGNRQDYLQLGLTGFSDQTLAVNRDGSLDVAGSSYRDFEGFLVSFGGGANRATGAWFVDQFIGSVDVEGTDTFSGGAGDDVLRGEAGDDLLIGNTGDDRLLGGHGRDRLIGGAGNDWLEGGLLTDRVSGGGGADIFVYNRVADFGASGNERITDFSHAEGDRIALSGIDPAPGIPRNQAFAFIGGNEFSGIPGQYEVRIRADGVFQILEGDVDGDAVADFSLSVLADAPLVEGDFYL